MEELIRIRGGDQHYELQAAAAAIIGREGDQKIILFFPSRTLFWSEHRSDMHNVDKSNQSINQSIASPRNSKNA